MKPEDFQTYLGVTAVSKIFNYRAFNQIQTFLWLWTLCYFDWK